MTPDEQVFEIDAQSALIQTMVLVAAAEGTMSDAELEMMGRLVQSLPVFASFDTRRIGAIGQECAALLEQEDGLDIAMNAIAHVLPSGLRETAYTLACDVAAADGDVVAAEINLLDIIRDKLGIDRLTAAAIERAAQARFRVS
ncbi:MAG: tellurite resistance TerB family protein [Pseudomonadota bacterium]